MHAENSTAADAAYAAESNLGQILGVLSSFFGLAITVVSMRIYVRAVRIKSMWIDDIMIILAVMAQLAGLVCLVVESTNGLGRHLSLYTADELTVFYHAYFFGNVIGITLGTLFLKLSIAFNLLRLCHENRWYKGSLYTLICIVFGYALVAIFSLSFQCAPTSYFWDKSIPGGYCKPVSYLITFGLINTSCNIFTDVSLAIIPIPIIWSMHMRTRVRLYLIAILSLGYIAVSMDVIKTIYQQSYTADTDETFTFSLVFFGFMELNLGMIAASIPMLKPLFGRALGLHNVPGHPGQNHRSNCNALRKRRIPWSSLSKAGLTTLDQIQTGTTTYDYVLDERDAAGQRKHTTTTANAAQDTAKQSGVQAQTFYRGDTGSEDGMVQSAAEQRESPPPIAVPTPVHTNGSTPMGESHWRESLLCVPNDTYDMQRQPPYMV